MATLFQSWNGTLLRDTDLYPSNIILQLYCLPYSPPLGENALCTLFFNRRLWRSFWRSFVGEGLETEASLLPVLISGTI